MTSSDWIALGALAISVAGWPVTYFITLRSATLSASNVRAQGRLDVAEHLAMDIALRVAHELQRVGNDCDGRLRLEALQSDCRKLTLILNDVFGSNQPQQVRDKRARLWETATGLSIPREALPSWDERVFKARDMGKELIEACRNNIVHK